MRFDDFLAARGFDPRDPRAFYRRMFVESWAQPSFRGFWRVWNPLYGYGLFTLYRALGGRRRPRLASLVVFLACGALLHDLPISLLTGRGVWATTVAFLCYWAILAWEARVGATLRGGAARNSLRIVGGLIVGAAVQRLLAAA